MVGRATPQRSEVAMRIPILDAIVPGWLLFLIFMILLIGGSAPSSTVAAGGA